MTIIGKYGSVLNRVVKNAMWEHKKELRAGYSRKDNMDWVGPKRSLTGHVWEYYFGKKEEE